MSDERLHTTKHQVVIYLMVFLGWGALWMASRQWIFMVPLALVFLLHPFIKKRVRREVARLHPELQKTFRVNPTILIYALMALIVLGLHQTNPIRGVGGNRFNNSFYGSLGALIYTALKIYSPVDRTIIPRVMLFTAIACGFSGAALPEYVGSAAGPTPWEQTSLLGPLTPGPHEFFAGLTGVYAVVAVAALCFAKRSEQAEPKPSRSRWVILGVSVIVVAGFTFGASKLEKKYYEKASQAWQKLAAGGGGGGGGFSDQANLDSVSNARLANSRDVALRIFAPREPGYLRGKAFVDYVGKGWDVKWPGGGAAKVMGRYPFPEGREVPEDEEPFLVIHPSSDYEEQFFLPIETCAVDTASEMVELHAPGHTLRSKSQPTTRGYGVFITKLPVRAEANLPVYTAMPKIKQRGKPKPGQPKRKTHNEELVEALDTALARMKFPEGASPTLIKDVIAGHFSMNYTYEVGVRFEAGIDPLTQFLRDGDRGHCELFASAGALLLRRKGIPARYVTGFVCQERVLGGEQWIARNEYAHAWVEFYTEDSGWQVAEFTPVGGVPQPVEAEGADALIDWLGGMWEKVAGFFIALPGNILSAIRAAITWVTGAWWRVALIVLVVAGLLFWRFGFGSAEEAKRERVREFTGDLAAKRARYLELERQLSKAGLGRKEWETLLEYAARLEGERLPEGVSVEETLAFLREFALLRYATST